MYWKIEGSGMGLIHSSVISSLACLHAVELMGPKLAISSSQRSWGIRWYRRYADNLVFIILLAPQGGHAQDLHDVLVNGIAP